MPWTTSHSQGSDPKKPAQFVLGAPIKMAAKNMSPAINNTGRQRSHASSNPKLLKAVLTLAANDNDHQARHVEGIAGLRARQPSALCGRVERLHTFSQHKRTG